MVKSFRLPQPKEPGAERIEMDIFQGDAEQIVDNEYLGSLRVPAAAAGRKIDFRLDEECLLQVVVDLPNGPKKIELATRDTPAMLRQALQEEARKREAEQAARGGAAEQSRGGLFSSIKRFWGGT